MKHRDLVTGEARDTSAISYAASSSHCGHPRIWLISDPNFHVCSRRFHGPRAVPAMYVDRGWKEQRTEARPVKSAGLAAALTVTSSRRWSTDNPAIDTTSATDIDLVLLLQYILPQYTILDPSDGGHDNKRPPQQPASRGTPRPRPLEHFANDKCSSWHSSSLTSLHATSSP